MKYVWGYETPIGKIFIAEENNMITNLYFQNEYIEEGLIQRETKLIKKAYNELEEYFSGKRREFDITLNPTGTHFMKLVWGELCNIPYSKTKTYKDIAKK